MEVLIGILLVTCSVVFVTAMVAWAWARERRAAVRQRAWEAFARGIGFAVKAPGKRELVRLEGRAEGLPIRVEVHAVEGMSRLVVLVTTRAHEPYDVALAARAGALPGFSVADLPARVRTGDAPFDAAFETWADDEGQALARLGDRLRGALQRFPTTLVGGGVGFRYERGEATISWPGDDVSEARISAAFAVLAAACPLSRQALQKLN